jgi:hypothetical protein
MTGQGSDTIPSFSSHDWSIIHLARHGITATTIAQVLSTPISVVLDVMGMARLSGVPMLRATVTTSRATREERPLAHLLLSHPTSRAPIVVPDDDLLTVSQVAAHYFVAPQLIRDAFAAGELPAVQVMPEGFWTEDVERYLSQNQHHFAEGRRPILGKTGLALALAREGFAPKTIGEATGWEAGNQGISSMLFALRVQGIDVPLFSSEYTATDYTPERVRIARQRAAAIEKLLPLEYYPPAETPSNDGKVPDELVREAYDARVKGVKWSDAEGMLRERGYHLSRQGFSLRYRELGLPSPSKARQRRMGGR